MVKMTNIALTVMLVAGITTHTALAADAAASESSTAPQDHPVASGKADASTVLEQPSQRVKADPVEPAAAASTSALAAHQQTAQAMVAPASPVTQPELVKPEAQTAEAAVSASSSATQDPSVASGKAGASTGPEQPSQRVNADATGAAAEASSSPAAANRQATQAVAAPASSTTQPEPVSKPEAQTTAPTAFEHTADKFTPEQEEQIGAIAKRYLLAHPEVLLEVSEKLDILQHEKLIKAITAAVVQRQDALLNDPAIPAAGPADAKVALIEFFDYQCVMCARQAPVIQSLMQTHPEVRYIFMEWPIFASRWEPSLTAAETGLMIWRQKGADAYLAYHNALFATGHQEGKLTQADIKKAASTAGRPKGKPNSMLDVVARTDALAQNLGFQGTPGLIVMPISGANADNVSVFPGVANASALQAAIKRAESAAK